MLDPYNYDTSLAYNNDSTHGGQDQCAQRGFVLPKSMISYRGTPGTEEGNAASIVTHRIVRTASFTTAFDDFGRVTDRTIFGDMADPTTFSCVHVDYAVPQTLTTPARVLNAVAQQIVYPDVRECGTVPIAKKRFEYDGFATSADSPIGHVSDGFVTSSTVTRYDLDSHNSLGDIRLFDESSVSLDSRLSGARNSQGRCDATEPSTSTMVSVLLSSALPPLVRPRCGPTPGSRHVQLLLLVTLQMTSRPMRTGR